MPIRCFTLLALAACSFHYPDTPHGARLAPLILPTGDLTWMCGDAEEIRLLNAASSHPQLVVATNMAGNWIIDNVWRGGDGLHFFAYNGSFESRYSREERMAAYGWEFVVPVVRGSDAKRMRYIAVSGHDATNDVGSRLPTFRKMSGIAPRPGGATGPNGDPVTTDVCWAPDGPLVSAAHARNQEPVDLRYFNAARFLRGDIPKQATRFIIKQCWTPAEDNDTSNVSSPLPDVVYFAAQHDAATLYFSDQFGNRGFRTASLRPDVNGTLLSMPWSVVDGRIVHRAHAIVAAKVAELKGYVFYFEIDGTGYLVETLGIDKLSIHVFPLGDLGSDALPPTKTRIAGPLLGPAIDFGRKRKGDFGIAVVCFGEPLQ